MSLKNSLEIYDATLEDIDQMVYLLKQLFSIEKDFTFNEKLHKEGLKLLLEENNSIITLVKDGQKVVAMVTMQILISTAMGSKTGLIEDFVITKEYRQQGIGTMLFNYLKAFSKENNIKRVQLLCDNDNTPAKEFYGKNGFKKSNLWGWYYHLN